MACCRACGPGCCAVFRKYDATLEVEIVMLADRIEAKWIDAFSEIFERCAVKPGDTAAILSETQSRALNVQLAELALLRLGARPFHIIVPTPRNRQAVRSAPPAPAWRSSGLRR